MFLFLHSCLNPVPSFFLSGFRTKTAVWWLLKVSHCIYPGLSALAFKDERFFFSAWQGTLIPRQIRLSRNERKIKYHTKISHTNNALHRSLPPVNEGQVKPCNSQRCHDLMMCFISIRLPVASALCYFQSQSVSCRDGNEEITTLEMRSKR